MQKKIYSHLMSLKSDIVALYADQPLDYRGRRISKEHVLEYFYKDFYRSAELISILRKYRDKKMLNIGIGYGFYDVVLKVQYGIQITGMDLPENIPVYSKLCEKYSIPVIGGGFTFAPLPIESEKFDVVVFSEVLEHLRLSPNWALTEIYRILKPGGVLVLTTPNIGRLTNILRLLVGKNILEEFPRFNPASGHITDILTHIREYTPSEVQQLMESCKYRETRCEYLYGWDRYNKFLMPRETPLKKSLKFILGLLLKLAPRLRSDFLIQGEKGIEQHAV